MARDRRKLSVIGGALVVVTELISLLGKPGRLPFLGQLLVLVAAIGMLAVNVRPGARGFWWACALSLLGAVGATLAFLGDQRRLVDLVSWTAFLVAAIVTIFAERRRLRAGAGAEAPGNPATTVR